MHPKGTSFRAQDKARIGEKAECTRLVHEVALGHPWPPRHWYIPVRRIFEQILNAVLCHLNPLNDLLVHHAGVLFKHQVLHSSECFFLSRLTE